MKYGIDITSFAFGPGGSEIPRYQQVKSSYTKTKQDFLRLYKTLGTLR